MLENIAKILSAVKDMRTEVLFYIVAVIFIFLCMFNIDFSNKTISLADIREVGRIMSLLIALSLILFGFFLSLESKSTRRIILFAPSIRTNLFYVELLDRIVETSTSRNIQVVVRKGIDPPHSDVSYIKLLKEFEGKNYKNTVIIMVLPSPTSYERIIDKRQFKSNAKINLITLDMHPDNSYIEKLNDCQFLRKIIILNNKEASEKVANTVVAYCEDQGYRSINIIICEGNFHHRGEYFKNTITEGGRRSNINIKFLGTSVEMDFSNALIISYNHVNRTINDNKSEVEKSPTFIFCSNDSMAMGARGALSTLARDRELNLTNVKIIGFDYTYIMKSYFNLRDSYMLFSVDQKYDIYADKAVDYAEEIFKGNSKGTNIGSKIEYISPGIAY